MTLRRTLARLPSTSSTATPSVPVNAYVLSSLTVIVAGPLMDGLSLTATTLKVSVFGTGSVSTPPLSVPPSSRTVNSRLAYPCPFASGAGRNTRLPASMSAARMAWPCETAKPLRVRLPFAGNLTTVTSARLSPSISVNPKSATESMWLPSSSTTAARSVPAGASLTGSTVISTCLTTWTPLASSPITSRESEPLKLGLPR